jgi:hypothetical protein
MKEAKKKIQGVMKDQTVMVMTSGLLLLLGVIVIGDFYVSLKEGKGPDDSVIELLQMSITGMVGIIAGYISGDKKKTEECNKDCCKNA